MGDDSDDRDGGDKGDVILLSAPSTLSIMIEHLLHARKCARQGQHRDTQARPLLLIGMNLDFFIAGGFSLWGFSRPFFPRGRSWPFKGL